MVIHTIQTLRVSLGTFNEIRAKLCEVGYQHAVYDLHDFLSILDMRGVALVCETLREYGYGVPDAPVEKKAIRRGRKNKRSRRAPKV